MSRPSLQGRVEEIVILDDKPSWGSRIGDVLGDVFSGIGAAVREYGPAVLQGLASASSLYSNSSSPYQSYDISPSSLPDYSSSSRTVRIQAPEPIKQRPLPEPRQTPRLMETYGRSLQERRARRQQQIEDLMATNEQAANRSGIAQHIVQNSGMPNLSNPSYGSPYQASVDVHPNRQSSLFGQPLNPQGQSSGWVQESPSNQRYAGQQPKSYAEMFKAQAQQAQQPRDLVEEYRREKRSHEQNMRQIRASMRTPGISDLVNNNQPSKPLSDNYFLDPNSGRVDPNRILQAGRPPSDEQLKRIFYQSDVELYGARTELEKRQAQKKLQQVKENLAIVMAGPDGLRNRDDYVIIGDQAYGQSEALYKALEDVEYFSKHDKHMPPLKYPAIPPENVHPKRHREVYPDVTSQVNRELQSIVKEIKRLPLKDGLFLLKRNAPNNAKWDTQVNHGLPGQVVLRDRQTGKPLTDLQYPDRVVTTDQYAYFRGRVRKAGYVSNYVYGYAIGALGIPKGATEGGAYYANFTSSGRIGDNPDDIQAMHDGYEAYWKDHPDEKRGVFQY